MLKQPQDLCDFSRRDGGLPRYVGGESSRLWSESVSEAKTELEILCGVAGARRFAKENARRSRPDVDYRVASVEADDRPG